MTDLPPVPPRTPSFEDAQRLLDELERRGVELRVHGGDLRLRGPRGAVDAAMRTRLAAAKPMLLAVLSGSKMPSRVPLTPNQRQLWFLDRLEERHAAYNLGLVLRLRGPLDVPRMAGALGDVIARHPALRIRLAAVDGEPVQQILPPWPVELSPVEVSALRLDVEIDAMISTPFDLEHDPLLRIQLLRVTPRDHALVVVTHHIVSDAWSSRVLVTDLAACYRARGSGPPPPPPPAAHAWPVRGEPSGPEDPHKVRRWWRERLGDGHRCAELPTDRPRPSRRRYTGARIRRRLEPESFERLVALARAEGTTPFVGVMAVFDILMTRMAGTEHVCVGVPVSNRKSRELESAVGLFVDTIAVRSTISADATFREVVRAVRADWLASVDHAVIPFAEVVAAVAPERDPGRSPLFQVMVNHVRLPPLDVDLPTLEVSVEETMPGSRFDLTLYVHERPDGVSLEAAYSTELFERARIEELLEQLALLVTTLTERPDAPVHRASLLTRRAARVLPDPKASLDPGPHRVVPDRLRESFESHASSLALRYAARSWTYAELARDVEGWAAALGARGVAQGDTVVILARRTADLVLAILTALRAGAVFVVLDADHPTPRLLDAVRRVKPSAWLRACGRAEPEPALLSGLDALPRGECPRPAAGPAPTLAPCSVSATSPCCITLTSGSTGHPRGVLQSHGPLAHFVDWYAQTFRIGPGDRVAVVSGLGHDPLLRDVVVPLCLGAAVHVPEIDVRLGDEGLAWMADAAITVAHLTPSMARVLIDARSRLTLPSVRWTFFGGEPLEGALAARWRGVAPLTRCVNFYGATETPQAVAWQPVDPGSGPVPLGRGIDGVSLLVVTPTGQHAGVGELGEIVVRSPWLATGYVDEPEATAARFTANPLGDGRAPDPVWTSGDLGRYRADGSVEFVGRRDRQLKIRGVRVEASEIELRLRDHPSVHEVVVGLDPSGRAIAWVVPEPGTEGTTGLATELRARVRRALPSPMVPAAVCFVDPIPLTPNGKVDLERLRQIVPAEETSEPEPELRMDSIERAIAQSWSEALDATISSDSNFFACGGHSLLATGVMARLSETLGLRLPLRLLFETRSVAGLAAAIRERHEDFDAPATAQIVRSDRALAPLSFPQERLWLLDQLDPDAPPYRVMRATRLEGPLDRASLDRALTWLEARHECLRTHYEATDGVPTQRIEPPRSSVLEVLGSPHGDAEAAVAELLRADTLERFDLEHGPVWRARLLPLSAHRHVLLLSVHHVACDGRSLAILCNELAVGYQASCRGERPDLPPPPVRYADFAHWQRQHAARGHHDAELRWWTERLAGLPTLDLPRRKSPQRSRTHDAGAVRLRLGPERMAALRAVAEDEHATVFMALATALTVVLHRHAAAREVVLGTPVGVRPDPGLESTVGMFLNTLVLRYTLDGDPPLREVLRRVRDGALDAFGHTAVPIERVVQALGHNGDAGRSSPFSVFLNVLEVGELGLELPGLRCTPIPRTDHVARFDLTLYALLGDRDSDAELVLVHDRNAFDEPQVQHLLGHLDQALHALVHSGYVRVSGLDLPRPRPRHASDLEPAPGESTLDIVSQVRAVAASAPRRIAIDTGTDRWTYDELVRSARALAQELLARLGRSTTRVGIMTGEPRSTVAAFLGALEAGMPYVPLDPWWPATRLTDVIDDAKIGAIVATAGTDGIAQMRVPSRLPVLHVGTSPPRSTDAEPLTRPSRAPPASSPSPAYILYTSGSTGRPKGVVQTSEGLRAHAQTYVRRLGLVPEDRVSLLSTFAFDAAIMDVFGALLAGATLCPFDLHGDTLAELPTALERREVTVYHSTPTVFRLLLSQLGDEPGPEHVRAVVLGGEPVRRDDLDRFLRVFPESCRFINGFGPTESTLALQFEVDRTQPPTAPTVPIGFPVGATGVSLRTDYGDQAAIYGVGEITLHSPHVATGYWKRPEQSARAFGLDPAGTPTYRTGDLGRWLPDGSIEFVRRADDQLKLLGRRIEPAEIEITLAAHPGVSASAVFPVSDPDRGTQLIAAVVLRAVPRVNGPVLRLWLAERLPSWMLPARVVVVDVLPRTPTGKVDRRALATSVGRPDERHDPARRRPDSIIETKIHHQWCQGLGIEQVGIDDSFFEVGGDSLRAVALAEGLQRILGLEVPLDVLFLRPTIAEQAAWVKDRRHQPRVVALGARAGLPLVCVLPPGERRGIASGLARRLQHPLLVVEVPSLSESDAPKTVEAIAALCRAELPDGPLVLAGFSNGGCVALELARQRAADGQPTPTVALLDANPPASVLEPSERPRHLASFELPERSWSIIKQLAGPLDTEDFDAPTLLETMRHDVDAGLEWLAERLSSARRPTSGPRLRPIFDALLEAHHRAWTVVHEWTPAPYDGRVDLFRADARVEAGFDVAPGWRRVVTDLRVHDVPGGHHQILRSPEVSVLAAALDRVLGDAGC